MWNCYYNHNVLWTNLVRWSTWLTHTQKKIKFLTQFEAMCHWKSLSRPKSYIWLSRNKYHQLEARYAQYKTKCLETTLTVKIIIMCTNMLDHIGWRRRWAKDKRVSLQNWKWSYWIQIHQSNQLPFQYFHHELFIIIITILYLCWVKILFCDDDDRHQL